MLYIVFKGQFTTILELKLWN